MQVKDKFNDCLRKKLINKIIVNKAEIGGHINKAKHYLKATDYNIKGGFSDVAVSNAFYAMYHSLLALLLRLGYESKNQECAINAIQHFIEQGKINLDIKYIDIIRRTNGNKPKDAKTLREEFQYGIETSVDKKVLDIIKNNAIEFVEAIEGILNELD
ncbi:HEPN domain-containing protein [Candidatus Woesearchaeota archaeon]|nr:HEPN domain-containing protein [Candidatus Woesearchaeota archaeon]